MLSKVEARKKIGEDSGNGKLLNEIEAISKTLYLDKNLPRTSFPAPGARSKAAGKSQLLDPKPKARNVNEELSQKDKKSIWNWKPLKALSNVRNRKFNCCFSLQVHSIEGLPSHFDNVSIRVHWKRRDGELVTRPVRVIEGNAEFEENLTHICVVYGSRSGPHHSAKYEAKHFLLYSSIVGTQELDLGKHRVDLTRFLPLTLEELEEEKSTGKWSTSFKLSGEAKGATLNVSFGYTVVGDGAVASRNNQKIHESLNLKQNNSRTMKSVPKFGQGPVSNMINRSGSLPGTFKQQLFVPSRSIEAVKDLHEVLPTSMSELATSVNLLYQKFDEDELDASVDKPEFDAFSEHLKPVKSLSSLVSDSNQTIVENEGANGEIFAAVKGIETLTEEQDKPGELAADFASSCAVEVGTNDCELTSEEGNELHQQDGSEDGERDEHVMQGIETLTEEQDKPGELAADFASSCAVEVGTNDCELTSEEGNELHQQDGSEDGERDEHVMHDVHFNEDDVCSKESVMKELESALNSLSHLESEVFDSPEEKESDMDAKIDCNTIGIDRTHSLDDLTESVANEFLDMLGIEDSPFGLSSESEPESPRERLLRQFEKDAQAGGYSLFDFDVDNEDPMEGGYSAATASGWGNFSEDFDLTSTIQAAEQDYEMETETGSSKTRAKILEDLETEALMREWGLNDKAFQSPPTKDSGGFGSPIDLPSEEQFELPPLGGGLGPFLQTKNGGFLRSMNPSIFRNSQSGGSLVMQVSSPVVVPAEMGSGIMDIMQQLASVGIEKLSMQANKLMPLEDITGKTIQQVAWEAGASLEGPERESLLQSELEVKLDVSGAPKSVNEHTPKSKKFSSTSAGNETCSEYVSLEDLAPLAMDKIEALSIEGLRIQSGISDEDAPANISAQSIGEISALQGKGIDISGSLGLEGTAGLQLLDIKDNGDDIDGLMGLSLTLDEWMRLDSGDIDDEDEISERTSRILAAHHASSLDSIRGGSKGERRRGKGSGRKCGLLGNNFTVALMVQLRDPLRDYEPVGAPMLALIQVERVFVPPKPKIYCKVSELRNNDDDEDELESVAKEGKKQEAEKEKALEEESVPQFQITEVHVAGLKTEPGKKKLWGTTNQQQSGSRWLLANGMAKSKQKQPFMKSKGAPAKSSTPLTTKAQPGDTLWSISSRIHGTGSKWKELAALNPRIRNPNVILPNETIKLR